MTFPNAPQTMLWLAFFADSDHQDPYMKDCATATSIYAAIQQALKTLNTNTGASWVVVWGPAIYSFPVNYKGRHVDNTVYVVRNGTSNDYAIAIAGTDSHSIADWFFEDFLVATTVPWFLEFTYNPRPRISLATFNGLAILLNISPPCAPIPGNGQHLLKFLSTIVQDGPINLYTTGHSLGGALATLCALDVAVSYPDAFSSLAMYSLGSPRVAVALGSTVDVSVTLYQQAVPNAYAIVHAADIVPILPPLSTSLPPGSASPLVTLTAAQVATADNTVNFCAQTGDVVDNHTYSITYVPYLAQLAAGFSAS